MTGVASLGTVLSVNVLILSQLVFYRQRGLFGTRRLTLVLVERTQVMRLGGIFQSGVIAKSSAVRPRSIEFILGESLDGYVHLKVRCWV